MCIKIYITGLPNKGIFPLKLEMRGIWKALGTEGNFMIDLKKSLRNHLIGIMAKEDFCTPSPPPPRKFCKKSEKINLRYPQA